jgi:peptidoglycan-associated lipoprotein
VNAAFLRSNPKLRVEIQGHSDERGTNNYNIALGERRANSTKKYLVAQGVDSNRVNIISYGEEKPFCTVSNNENCWYLNRRAHFRVAR